MLFKTKNFQYSKLCLSNIYLNKVKTLNSSLFSFSQIIKLTINRGLGSSSFNKKLVNLSIEEFRAITGQHPKFIYAKKSIASFKLREKILIGLMVTLRKERMYSFLDRFIHLAVPQIQDFKGFSFRHFDSFGNYNFGIHDQGIFSEIPYEHIISQFGFNFTIVFLNKNKEKNILLLKNLGFPLQ
jgi:large subunit ribosomal protein L5